MRFATSFATVFVMGALQGCTCSHAEPFTLGKVDSPVGVEVVKNVHVGPKTHGRDIDAELKTSTSHDLKIASTPPIVIPIHCGNSMNVEVSVAKTFDRVAYRCHHGVSWDVVWIGTSEKFLGYAHELDIKPTTGPESWLDANTVPTLVAIAPLWLARGARKPEAILKEINRTDGKAAVFEALSKSASMQLVDNAPSNVDNDPWILWRNTLPNEKKAQLDTVLRTAIETPRPGVGALARAIRVLDPADPTLPDLWTARLREIDEDLPKSRPVMKDMYDVDWDTLIWQELLHQLIRTRPTIAGEIACRDLELRERPIIVSLVAVARGTTPCPILTKIVDKLAADPWCNLDIWCKDSGKSTYTCSPQALAEQVDEFVKKSIHLRGGKFSVQTATLAAGMARGVVPKEFALRLERAGYTVDMPSAPRCQNAQPGSPCSCYDLSDKPISSICRTKADTTTGELKHCSYKIDDKKKRITNVVARKAD